MLENPLPEVACEEERVGIAWHQRRQHAQLPHGKVLRLIGNGMGEWLVRARAMWSVTRPRMSAQVMTLRS